MGFGVSDYEDVRPYLDAVDGVVAGSYIIEGIQAALPENEDVVREVDRRVRALSEPLHAYRPAG